MLYNILKNYYLKKRMSILNKNIEIFNDIILSHPEIIEFKDNVYIGPRAKVFGKGKLKIANNVIIGNDFSAYTSVHNYKDEYIPYGFNDNIGIISIEDNVWIGAEVSIMPGVTIEEGAIVGLGSVVTKDVKQFEIVAGNPAKVINYRDITKYNEMKKNHKFYLNMKRSGKL